MKLQAGHLFTFLLSAKQNQARLKGVRWRRAIYIAVLFCIAGAIASPAQSFTSLASFDVADGYFPTSTLTQGTDGNFYGATPEGGQYGGGGSGQGVVYRMTAEGALTVLYNFCDDYPTCTDGAYPSPGLVLASDGNFYGTTSYGSGTVFEITPAGKLTTLYTFCSQPACADGAIPNGLMQASNGNFYGTTAYGCGYSCGSGTVFEITPSGKLTTLYAFCSLANCADGSNPYGSALVQATNGNFYGTTPTGGAHSSGTVFEITPAGKLTTLYSFCSQRHRSACTDGAPPNGLMQASNGNFYGTTVLGGSKGGGTVFEINAAGKFSTLYNFANTGGNGPESAVTQGSDGNLYGTTTYGTTQVGSDGWGTIFEITTTGELTTLYTFDFEDGANPEAALMQATNGAFYGTTTSGGTNRDGTVFSVSVGVGPFVTTLPSSGKAGTKVAILGNSLTDATTVTFNGMAAIFRVASGNEITTTVPAGATSGIVAVSTSSGTLKSNVKFRVLP